LIKALCPHVNVEVVRARDTAVRKNKGFQVDVVASIRDGSKHRRKSTISIRQQSHPLARNQRMFGKFFDQSFMLLENVSESGLLFQFPDNCRIVLSR